MSVTLLTIWNVFQKIAPWIIVSFLPSLITGLTLFPQLAPEAAFLQKVLVGIQRALNFFSITTHKDEVGTFKLPLKLSKLPNGATTVVLALSLVGVLIGCGVVSTTGQAALDCGKQAVQAEIMNLVPAVTAILNGSPADWEAQLNALESVGEDALLCTVEAVVKSLKVEPNAPLSPARANGMKYLHDHKVVLK